MIALFGAPGSGKSLQGQLLAARHDWRWLSTGQILRDSRNEKVLKHIKDGKMIDDTVMYPLISEAIRESSGIENLVLDGFPRTQIQAKWLFESSPHLERKLKLVIHIVVPEDELNRRLKLRGRADDRQDEREYRQEFFQHEMKGILKIFEAHGVDVIRVNGDGSVGTVHDRIEEVLETCSLA